MGGTIGGRFRRGLLEPVEQVELSEGAEVAATIVRVASESTGGPFEGAAGAWKDLIDAEEFIRDIYRNRLISTRAGPRL